MFTQNVIKHDSGVVKGYVVESTIFQFKEELFASKQKEFAALGQNSREKEQHWLR